MTLRASLLVLLSALLHAVWNALIKHEKEPRSAGLAVLAVATAVAVGLALASSGLSSGAPFPTAPALRWALAAGLFEGAYFAALGLALARGPLGPVYTVARGGAMLVTWPISVLFLSEPFSWLARAGVLLVGAGLGLTALRSREHARGASLAWAAVCAVCIGGYHLSYKLALEARAEPRALFAVALLCALPINLVSLGAGAVRGAARALRASPVRVVVGGVTCTASFVVLLQALAASGAGAVLTLRNTSILFAQAFALWGGERIHRRALVGAGLVVAGAALLSR